MKIFFSLLISGFLFISVGAFGCYQPSDWNDNFGPNAYVCEGGAYQCTQTPDNKTIEIYDVVSQNYCRDQQNVSLTAPNCATLFTTPQCQAELSSGQQ